MRRFSPDLQHALAAEYVLGTMRGRARTRFEALARADRTLAAVVRSWEGYLTPLAARLEPVAPPARVWHAIESRLAPRASAPAPSLWSSLAFWRALGAGLAVAVVALALTLGGTRPEQAPGMVAVLETPEKDPRMVVEEKGGQLTVRMVKPWTENPASDLELWVVPKDGKPRSLGVIAAHQDSRVRLADLGVKLRDGVAFAVSREPRGGSPTGAPTGPVLCSGAIVRTQRV